MTTSPNASAQWRDVLLLVFLLVIAIGVVVGHGMVIAFGVMGLVSGAIAIVWCRLSLEDVTYERQLPEQHVFIGDVVRITLSLTNKKPLPLPWVPRG